MKWNLVSSELHSSRPIKVTTQKFRPLVSRVECYYEKRTYNISVTCWNSTQTAIIIHWSNITFFRHFFHSISFGCFAHLILLIVWYGCMTIRLLTLILLSTTIWAEFSWVASRFEWNGLSFNRFNKWTFLTQ